MGPIARRHRRPIFQPQKPTPPFSAGTKSDINITPLIDVMMVLLIIFMVILPAAQRGIDTSLPQETGPDHSPPPSILLTISDSASGPSCSVNQHPAETLDALDSELRSLFGSRRDKTVFVRAAGNVPYGTVVKVLDVARGAGVERIGIVSEKIVRKAPGRPD